MPNYIWKAIDHLGNSVVVESFAESASESKSVLERRGYARLELYQDDIGDAASAGMLSQPVTVLGQEIEVSAADRIQQLDKPQMTMWRAVGEGLMQSKALILIVVMLTVYLLYKGHTISGCLAVLSLVLWIVFLAVTSVPLILYQRLNKAVEWCKWEDVLNLVQELRAKNRRHFIKVPEAELARNRAKALAGLGRIEEGLAEYRSYENQPGCPTWLHKAYVAGIYDTARQYDKAVEMTLKSIQEHDSPSFHVDLAYRYARHLRDVGRARCSLNEAEKAILPEFAKPFLLRSRGAVAYLEGNLQLARTSFEESIAYMEKTPNQPFREGSIFNAKAHLACVIARQGQVEHGKKIFAQATEYLRATKEIDLINEFQAACQSR
jgi:tetratricopeptide (TPR) repeat protein